MIALKIKNVKQFMNLLFMTEAFDGFTLEEAVIKTCLTYNIDGLYEPGFYSGDDPVKEDENAFFDGFTPWKLVRPHCTGLIKGKNTPVFMKFVFHGSPEISDLSGKDMNIRSLLIMIRFESTGLTLTTGTSQNTFSLDHEADKIWDSRVRQLLDEHSVEYGEL